MKKVFLISFCLLITRVAFAQEKKDSVATEKFSLLLRGGINTSRITGDLGNFETSNKRSNEFFELNTIYPVNSLIKISLGAAFHHFSYYTAYNVYVGTNSTIYSFKMTSLPAHLILTTNENKKIYLNIYTGPEVGFVLNQDATNYINSNLYYQYNLQYEHIAFFFSLGADINYSYNKKIAIGFGASSVRQINDLSIIHDSPNTGGIEYITISYISLSINLKYKFN